MCITPMYLIANCSMRKNNRNFAKYNFNRSIHAVRDGFTPAFTHRQTAKEVRDWFNQNGFNNLVQLKEKDVPLSAKPDFRMNIGIRGVRHKLRE